MGPLLFIVIVSAVPTRSLARPRNRKLFIYGPLMGIAEVMPHAQRKTLEMPVLRLFSHNQQGKEGDQADGDSKDTLLQRLQTQIHAQEPKAQSGHW